MEDSVRVFVRVRPPVSKETEFGFRSCLSTSSDAKNITILTKPDAKNFAFDHVADSQHLCDLMERATQEDMFAVVGKPICEAALNGIHATIFCYGQTGSGKTFTMSGPTLENCQETLFDSNRGLLPRIVDYLFNQIAKLKSQSSTVEFTTKVSYMEIYNERPFDLLDPDSQNLTVREDVNKGVYLENLKEVQVSSPVETLRLALVGAKNRRVASTAMNRESSRSHALFCLTIISKDTKDGITRHRSSRFHMCDLAGSERQSSTLTQGAQLTEAGAINKSLSILGNVIMALVDIANGKSRHVHYRDSKLTFLLKDSLGGNSMTFIIANVSPAEVNIAETLSTLKFAARAKFIKNNAQINEDTSGSVAVLMEEIRRLKEQLRSGMPLMQQMIVQPNSTPSRDRRSSEMIDEDLQAKSVMNVPNFMQLHRYAQRQLQMMQEVAKLKEQATGYTELIASYDQELQNQKLISRLKQKEIESLISKASESNPEVNESFEGRINNLNSELEILQRNVDLSPVAISWCLRFSLLEDKIYREAPWLLSSSGDSDVSAPLVSALEESRKQQELLQKDLAELTSNYENLRKEQDKDYIQNPERLWSKLSAQFKMAIPEIRDAAAAKVASMKKVDALKLEKENMQIAINDLELKKVGFERMQSEMEEMGLLHQREIAQINRHAQERLNQAVAKAVSECTEKYRADMKAELSGGESQIQAIQMEHMNILSSLASLESNLKMSQDQVQSLEADRLLLENTLNNYKTKVEESKLELSNSNIRHAEMISEERKLREDMVNQLNEQLTTERSNCSTLLTREEEALRKVAHVSSTLEDVQEQLQASVIAEANLRVQLDAEIQSKTQLSNDYESKLFELESLQQDNETLTDTNSTLVSQINELNISLRDEQVARESDNKKLSEIIDDLQVKVAALSNSLSSKATSENEQVVWLTSEREGLLLEISNLRNVESQLSELKSNHFNQLQTLNEALATAKAKEATLLEATQSFSDRIEALLTRNKELEVNATQLSSELERNLVVLTGTNAELVEKERLYSEITDENKNLSNLVISLRNEKEQENSAYKADVAAHVLRITTLEEKFALKVDESLESETNWKTMLENSKETIEKLTLESSGLKSEIEHLQTRLQSRETELENISQAARGTQEDLLQKSQKRESELRQQFTRLETAYFSLTNQYNQQELSLGRLSEKMKKTHSEYESSVREKLSRISTLQARVGELESLVEVNEEKLQTLKSQHEAAITDLINHETVLENELKNEHEILSSADTQIQYLESRVLNYEHQLQNYEDLIKTRLTQTSDVSERLARFVQLENTMYAEREAREDEIRKLKEKVCSLELEIDKTNHNLEAAVEEKFKLAQSKNHLQRIHLLDDTKKKLDTALTELSAEHQKVKGLQIRLKKALSTTSADIGKDDGAENEWLEQELQRQRKVDRGILSLVRILNGEKALDDSVELKPGDLSENSLLNCLDKVKSLLSQNRLLSEKVMDESRKQILSDVTALSHQTRLEAEFIRTKMNDIAMMSASQPTTPEEKFNDEVKI